jgi:hypothetical protein
METHRGGTDEPETVDFITLGLTSALGAGGFNKKRKRPSPTSEIRKETAAAIWNVQVDSCSSLRLQARQRTSEELHTDIFSRGNAVTP